jgi:hypothetical protein
MMRAVAQITVPLGIKTMVSLNSIMVDGTGMCGGCRVLLGNKSKFACVDGPEFDASLVNFEVLMQRNAMYRDKECQSLRYFEEHKEEELAQLRAELAAREKEVAELEIAELLQCRRSIMSESETSVAAVVAASDQRNTVPLKDRMKIPRTVMPELDPQVRSRNFEEVNLGPAHATTRSLRPRAALSAPSPAASFSVPSA